jgi:hypothetical protein
MIALKRRRPTFRLRMLLLAVAVLCAAMAGFPWVMWRYHVDRAFEGACAEGPAISWSLGPFQPAPLAVFQASRRDDLGYLLSDKERVLPALLYAAEHDAEALRRRNAIQTMQAILKQPVPSALRKRCIDRALELATRPGVSAFDESEFALVIADWSSSTWLDARQRSLILERANTAPQAVLPAWVRVLAAIGGHDETLFLVGLGSSHEISLLDAVHNSSLQGSHWLALLPALKRWLGDSAIAPHALRYSLLSVHAEGRSMLLAYATCDAHPVELRRQAIERLQETIPGTTLLLNALEDRLASKVLAASVEGDAQETFRAALSSLERRKAAFWSDLIDGIDSGYPESFSRPSTAVPKSASEAERFIRQHTTVSRVRCLQWITGRTDLRSRAEWEKWNETARPSPPTQYELAKLALEHPDVLNTSAVLRRIVPHYLGRLPPDCIPLYERMAREGPPAARYYACATLLLYTPSADAAPIVFDIIARSRPDNITTADSWPIELLRKRFAENFFWDSAAWRQWWVGYSQAH